MHRARSNRGPRRSAPPALRGARWPHL